MAYKRLRIFVEGNDDKRFIENICHLFVERYDNIEIRTYAQESARWVKKFLNSIQSMGDDYFFLADINSLPCIIAKKEEIARQYAGIDITNVRIVIKEIESWYLAGLDDNECKKLGISVFNKTDSITKEKFDLLKPRKFNSRIDFMIEILKSFSIEIAKTKNESFEYFVSKVQPIH